MIELVDWVVPMTTDLSLDTRSRNIGQVIMAAVVVVICIVTVVATWIRTKSVGLPTAQAKTREFVNVAIDSAKWRSSYVYASDSRDEWRDTIERILDDRPDEHAETIGDAVASARSAAYRQMSKYPLVARRIGSEAIVMLVLGLAVVVPLEWWRRVMHPELPEPSFDAFISVVSDIGDIGAAALSVFPIPSQLLDLAMAISILGWSLAYDYSPVVAIVMIIGVSYITYLYHRAGRATIPYAVRPRKSTVFIDTLLFIGGVYIAGAIPYVIITGIDTLIPYDVTVIAVVVGFLSASVVAILFAYWIIIDSKKSLARAVDVMTKTGLTDRQASVYVSLTYSLYVVGVLVAPVIVALLVAGLSGRFSELADLWRDAPLITKAIVFVLSMVSNVVTAYMFRDALRILIRIIRRSMSRSAVRWRVAMTALPVFAMAAAFIYSSALFGFFFGAIVSIIIGLILRLIAKLLHHIKYRFKSYDSMEGGPRERAFVEVTDFNLPECAGSDKLYVARINATAYRLAAPTREEFVDALVSSVDELLSVGRISPTVYSHLYNDATLYGQVTTAQSVAKLRRKIRENVLGNIKANGGIIAKHDLEEKITEEIPEDVFRDEIKKYRTRGKLDETDTHYRYIR